MRQVISPERTARGPVRAARPERPGAWLVFVVSFLVATIATLALLVVRAPDPCVDRGLSSGSEGMGYAIVALAVLFALVLTVLVIVLAVLIRAGHRTMAMAILGASLGMLAGAILAGTVNGWRSERATEEQCRALLGLPPPPIRGVADITLLVDTAPFRGRTSLRGTCELTPDGVGTLSVQVPPDVLMTAQPRIGSWTLADLYTAQPLDSPPATLELEAHRFQLVLGFLQPGRSVVYGAQGNSGWTLELDPAGTRVIRFNELPQMPELGGGSSVGAPAAVSGAVSWNCTAGERSDE